MFEGFWELNNLSRLGDYLLRVFAAVLAGFAIGYERKTRSKEAGVRTHTLVCMASALMMIISKYGFVDQVVGEGGIRGADGARIAAQIVSGIGFLGAGIIVYRKDTLHGLTTAAGIWATAGIGLAVGAGMYGIGIVATALVLLGLEVLGKFFGHLGLRSMMIEYSVSDKALIGTVSSALEKEDCIISSYEMKKSYSEGKYEYRVSITVRAKRLTEHALLQLLQDRFPEVTVAKII